MNYTGYRHDASGTGERFLEMEIGPKAMEMIGAAEETILFPLFLFDSFYASGVEERDMVGMVTESMLEKRAAYPDIRIAFILDANKDSFDMEKDGTPNRQAARYLLRKARETGGELEFRWYSTHGEQNHAKTMSITNPSAGRHWITTGSANWTGRNLAGVNMEANVVVDGAPALNSKFNDDFDLFWTNRDGNEYSLHYDAFKDATAADAKWRRGETPFYLGTF